MEKILWIIALAIIFGSTTAFAKVYGQGATSVLEGESFSIEVFNDSDYSATTSVSQLGPGIGDVTFDNETSRATIQINSAPTIGSTFVKFMSSDGTEYTYIFDIIQKVKPESYGAIRVNATCDFHDTGIGLKGGILHFSYEPQVVDTIMVNPDGAPWSNPILQTTRKVTFDDDSVLNVGGFIGEIDLRALMKQYIDTAWVAMGTPLGTNAYYNDNLIGDQTRYGYVSTVVRGTQGSEIDTWRLESIYGHGPMFEMEFDSGGILGPRSGTYRYYFSGYNPELNRSEEAAGNGTFVCSYSDVRSEDVLAAIDRVNTYIERKGGNLDVSISSDLFARLSVAVNLDQVAQIRADAEVVIAHANLVAKRVGVQRMLSDAVLDGRCFSR